MVITLLGLKVLKLLVSLFISTETDNNRQRYFLTRITSATRVTPFYGNTKSPEL